MRNALVRRLIMLTIVAAIAQNAVASVHPGDHGIRGWIRHIIVSVLDQLGTPPG